MSRILVVEDDPIFSAMVVSFLKRENFLVDLATDGEAALEFLRVCEYDLLILDWTLPGQSGIDILTQYRSKGGTSPVLVLTGRQSIQDKEIGFNAGTDDYLTKPFNPTELGLRVKALLRRSTPARSNNVTVGNIVVCASGFAADVAGQKIELSPNEFRMLELLATHAETVFSVEALLNRIWGSDSDATANSVRICMTRLRAKLTAAGANPNITTVHGAGYVLTAK